MSRVVIVEKESSLEVPQDSGEAVSIQNQTSEVPTVVETQNFVVEIPQEPNTVVSIEAPPPEVVEVITRGVQGPVGPEGPPGPAGPGNDAYSIVGYPVVLADGQPDDLMYFTGSEWSNKPQEKVTDGGNF